MARNVGLVSLALLAVLVGAAKQQGSDCSACEPIWNQTSYNVTATGATTDTGTLVVQTMGNLVTLAFLGPMSLNGANDLICFYAPFLPMDAIPLASYYQSSINYPIMINNVLDWGYPVMGNIQIFAGDGSACIGPIVPVGGDLDYANNFYINPNGSWLRYDLVNFDLSGITYFTSLGEPAAAPPTLTPNQKRKVASIPKTAREFHAHMLARPKAITLAKPRCGL
jgi:hypothetical protein